MKIGASSSVPLLNKCLTDSDMFVRNNAAGALGRLAEMEIGNSSSVPLLNKCLTDSDAVVRRNAAGALGRLAEMKVGDSSSVPLLNNCLTDSDAVVRRYAKEALDALNQLLEKRRRCKLEEERQAMLKQASNYERARNWLKALELYEHAGNTEKVLECAMNHAQRLCSEGKVEEAAAFLESHGMFEEAWRIRERAEARKRLEIPSTPEGWNEALACWDSPNSEKLFLAVQELPDEELNKLIRLLVQNRDASKNFVRLVEKWNNNKHYCWHENGQIIEVKTAYLGGLYCLCRLQLFGDAKLYPDNIRYFNPVLQMYNKPENKLYEFPPIKMETTKLGEEDVCRYSIAKTQ
jgi:tetratricopeptide (TPR) repeat protein